MRWNNGASPGHLARQDANGCSRITCGPPNFAPDGLPIRTVADELEQIELGPSVWGRFPWPKSDPSFAVPSKPCD